MPLFLKTGQVGASYQLQFLDILPHFALPPTLVLSLFCPPFRGRATLFVALIVLLDYACLSSPWPSNVGSSSRSMKYGLTGPWFFILPVVEKLLLHIPEREFWREDDPKGPSGAGPRDLSWEKLRWAAALVATPRGVGWNFASRQIKAKREAVRSQGLTRVLFVARKVFRALVAYLALDICLFAAKRAVIPEQWAWNVLTIGRIAFLELLMGASTYAIMSMQFDVSAAIGVGLLQNQPEDWPPLFGNILNCYTVANVWGKFWHDYIRQPVLGFSHGIVALLKLPRRSTSAYLIHLATAFLISAFFHIVSISVVCPGYLAIEDLVADMGIFFTAQPIAAIAEKLVMDTYTRATSSVQSQSSASTKDGVQDTSTLPTSFPHRMLGYAWVITWFVFSGWWFVRPYAAVGIMEWPLPFSFVENVL